jgi:hypothetical protein
MPNIAGGGAYLPTGLTRGQAVARIARVVQGSSQPNALTEASEALEDSYRWWNRRNWKALLKTAPTLTVSAAVTDYPLPPDFKKTYSVRLADRPLFFCSQRNYDKMVWDQDQQVGATHYTPYPVGQENKIRLLPQHDKPDTLTVRYYSAITLPANDDTILSIPETWVQPLVDYAKSLICASRGQDGRRNFFMQLAVQGMRSARGDDLTEPDQEQGLEVAPNQADPWSNWSQITRHYGF